MDEAILKRTYEGILSVIFSLRKVPQIKYLANSQASRKIAMKLTNKI